MNTTFDTKTSFEITHCLNIDEQICICRNYILQCTKKSVKKFFKKVNSNINRAIINALFERESIYSTIEREYIANPKYNAKLVYDTWKELLTNYCSFEGVLLGVKEISSLYLAHTAWFFIPDNLKTKIKLVYTETSTSPYEPQINESTTVPEI